MTTRWTIRAVAVAIALSAFGIAAAAAPATAPANRFKLKPGAQGKLCFGCHTQFEDTLKLPFVHTPVKSGDCSDCHDPHASDHGKFLVDEPAKICVSCHSDIAPEKARSVHKDVADGQCVKCHDPHGAANKANLLKAGSELCFGCHGELGKAVAEARFKHPPVMKSCLTCHDPHSGATTDNLLVKAVPAVCLDCHKTDQPAFKSAHLNYPMAKSDCTSCHDPHGSSQPSILWANVHLPVKNKMCAQCHNAAAAPDALQTKKEGLDTCRACHGDMLNATLDLNRVHGPVLDRKACLNCHRPHASPEPKLLRAKEGNLCAGCHADAVARQARSVTKHPPIQEGACSACHLPHGSNDVFLLANGGEPEVCGTCHDWSKHSMHPIGPNVIDPRNKNLAVNCDGCHRTHGSEFKHLAHFDTRKELCLQCHTKMGD